MGPPDPQKLRREFRLPADDETFLGQLELPWETVTANGQRWVLIYGQRIPTGYQVGSVDIAVMMAPGYPPGPLDMAYFFPPLVRTDGVAPRSAEGRVTIDDKAWQAWSRHRDATGDCAWQPGEDNLESHYLYLLSWLTNELQR
jgi:hypothetical protein